jgi:3-hydroxybutyryl-CoA dehydrogenase
MSKPVEGVAVVGVGTLGTQIAMLAANAGYRIKIFDLRERTLDETLERFRQTSTMESLIPLDQWRACRGKIQQLTDLDEAIRDVELVVEAIPEDLDLKRQTFQELGQKAPPEAILATNSSSIPVSRLEESSGRPERCLNLHFYLGMNMADVVGGTQTLPEVREKGIAWVRSLGCIPLTVKKELLGFCFNRVWRAVKREVLYMWANGFVDFRDVDRAWMVFNGMKEGPRFGPFGLMDKVGLDVIYDIEMVYYRDSGDPKDHPPEALKDKVDKNELGVKTGKGFYSYPDPEYLRTDFLNPVG